MEAAMKSKCLEDICMRVGTLVHHAKFGGVGANRTIVAVACVLSENIYGYVGFGKRCLDWKCQGYLHLEKLAF